MSRLRITLRVTKGGRLWQIPPRRPTWVVGGRPAPDARGLLASCGAFGAEVESGLHCTRRPPSTGYRREEMKSDTELMTNVAPLFRQRRADMETRR